jgi:hypothetical protein
VKAKDATVIGSIGVDKRQLLLKQPTSIRSSGDEVMEALAKRFEQLARDNTKVVSDQ